MFLDNGADVNTKDKIGQTPLDLVIQNGDWKLYEILNEGNNM